MLKKNSQYLLLLPLLLSAFASCSQNTNSKPAGSDSTIIYSMPSPGAIDPKEAASIRASAQMFYDTMLRNSNFNGGMIVAKKGNIIFEQYKGSVNMDGKDPVTENTAMHIASVSKTFTAMAILKLQEEGKLNIDDPFTKYFPDFNYSGVTIKTLLDHRSGLPKYEYFMEKTGWDKDSVIQNKDLLQWMIEKKNIIKDIRPADKAFNYCNTNYALLALVIEKVTGKPFPQYMQETMFDPFGMKNTFVHYTNDHKVLSKSFENNGRLYEDNFLDGIYGDKNVYTTPRDLLIWDRVLADTLFLSAKSLESSYQPYSNEKRGIKNYGFGWHLEIYPNGKKLIFHNGWWHGNNAAFVRLPEQDATIIITNNRFTKNVYKAKLLANSFDHYFDVDSDEPAAGEKDSVVTKKPVVRKVRSEKAGGKSKKEANGKVSRKGANVAPRRKG